MPRHRSPHAFRNFAGALAAALAVACAAAGSAAAATDAIVVRYRDSAVASTSPGLPADTQARLAAQLGARFSVDGRTSDGAWRIALDRSLTIDEARAAVNRVRMDGAVLYAAIAPPVGATAIPEVIDPALSPPTDRLVVRFRDAAQQSAALAGIPPDQAQVDRLASVAGATLAFRRYMHDGAAVLQLMQRTPVADVERMAARIAAMPDIDFAQPDYIDQAHLTPNDPCYSTGGLSLSGCAFSYQWDLFDPAAGINAPAAWDITTGLASIRVAVIDTGALFAHPDLSSRFIAGYDMITSGGSVDPRDGNSRDADASDAGDWTTANQCFVGSGASNSSWHGTHVAGTIGAAGNNAAGIAGINWASPILPVRALGACGGYSSDIADGIAWAAGGAVAGVPSNTTPARVLNLSLGGFRFNQTCDTVYTTAINVALSQNAVVVVSAGNNNWDASYNAPANCTNVITVAATGEKGYKSYYSNWGLRVEIAAPGGDFRFNATTAPNQYGILSSLNDGTTAPASHVYREYQGTSMAAPHVAGVASLMLSVGPSLTPAQVLAKMQAGARGFVNSPPVACTNLNFPANSSGANGVASSQWSACECTTSLCGAGFLDAFRAVAISQPGGAATTTGLVSSANPAAIGVNVTFTATVNGIAPTGSVTFRDGAAIMCANVPLLGGGDARTAACVTNTLLPGSHSITATYNGDGNNATSTSVALVQVIDVAVSTTTLATSGTPSVVGATVTFTATVTGYLPGSTVGFTSDAATIAGCAAVGLVGTSNSRTAQCPTSALSVGSHAIVATYIGDANNTGSTSNTVTQTVNASPGACVYALSPLDLSNTPAAGGALNVTVTTPPGCPVTAVSFQPWVNVNSITPSGGTTTVALQISPNAGAARATAIVVADRLYLITQLNP